jgi:hypothetical protein
MAAGAVFGAIALSDKNQASNSDCLGGVCDQHGYSSNNDAKQAATASTLGFAIGGGLVAAGLVLWITAPSDSRVSGLRASLSPFVSSEAAGTMIRGSF